MAKLRLKRLKIEKFRNVAPTELHFNDGFNVLLGKNGTGKTTLLKLAAMALSSNFTTLQQTPFAIEYQITHDEFDLTVMLRNDLKPREIDAIDEEDIPLEIRLRGERTVWAYSIRLLVKETGREYRTAASSDPFASEQNPNDREIQIDQLLPSPFESGFAFWALLRLHNGTNAEARRHLRQAARQTISGGLARLDEGLGGFAAMTSAAEASSDELGNSQIAVYGDERKTFGHDRYFIPMEMTSILLNTIKTLAPTISLTEAEIEFLRQAVEVMGFKAGELAIELKSKDVFEGTTVWTYGRFAFRLTLQDGSIISHPMLSYGQKRMLAFLYYLAVYQDVVIVDELVNGLHYEWIEYCLNAIGERQAFLTSQNPLLLDFLPFESAEEVQRTFILCGAEQAGGHTRMNWSNLSDEDAQRFYLAYDAGLQHVGEILRTKGLW